MANAPATEPATPPAAPPATPAAPAFALPVASHVARREAGRAILGSTGADAWFERFVTEALRPVAAVFARGDRLAGPAFAAAVDDVRSRLVAFGALRIEERARPATRARPKGDEHEILTVTRGGDVDAPERPALHLISVRFHLTRRHSAFDVGSLGLDYSRHLLERSIERGLASWTGRFEEVEAALLDATGLVAAWRRAVALGYAPSREFAVPLGDGLALGDFRAAGGETGYRSGYGRNGVREDRIVGNPFLSPGPAGAAPGPPPESLLARCSTVVGEDLLRLPQLDLRDALRRFMADEAPALAAAAHAAAWGRVALAPRPPEAETLAGLDRAARRLAALLARPALAGALRAPATPGGKP